MYFFKLIFGNVMAVILCLQLTLDKLEKPDLIEEMLLRYTQNNEFKDLYVNLVCKGVLVFFYSFIICSWVRKMENILVAFQGLNLDYKVIQAEVLWSIEIGRLFNEKSENTACRLLGRMLKLVQLTH